MKIRITPSKIYGVLFALGVFAFSAQVPLYAQSASGLFKSLKEQFGGKKNNASAPAASNLSNSEVTAGLKQALEIGAKAAAQQLSQKDGFFKDPAVKILLPPQAQKVATTLRSMGMGDLVDQVVLKMNRAAEAAAVKAAPIFVQAIKGITIQDGLQILTGGDDAATQYLKSKTTPALTAAFSPVIKQALAQIDAPQIWQKVFSTYNQIPFIPHKINPDMVSYVTAQALKGIFTKIAGEELNIRQNPSARVTDLLQNVFGKK